MISKIPAAVGRARHFGFEAAAALTVTLCAASVAYAAIPIITGPAKTEAPKVLVAAVEAEPAPPPPVFECGNPVPGHAVNSPFGLRRLPWENHGRLHEGVDIAAPTGAKVLAVADGIVLHAGNSPSYGRYVEVQHGVGLTSFYAHLGRIDRDAKVGAYVRGGEQIGAIGSSGTSTGPHIHFEIRQDKKPLNPMVFMNREFATAEDLPLKVAAYVSPHVRIAQVSEIPESKKALMEAKAGKKTKGGRVRATLAFDKG